MKNRDRTSWHCGAAWMFAIALMAAAGSPGRAEVPDSAAVASLAGQRSRADNEVGDAVVRALMVRYGYGLAALGRDPGWQAVITTILVIDALRQPPIDPGSDWPPFGQERTPGALTRRESDGTAVMGAGMGCFSGSRTDSRLVPNAGRRHDGHHEQQRIGAAWTNR
jgi:hypothetical protein